MSRQTAGRLDFRGPPALLKPRHSLRYPLGALGSVLRKRNEEKRGFAAQDRHQHAAHGIVEQQRHP